MKNHLVETLTACIAELLFQMEYADEQAINSDFSLKLMEFIGAELQGLDEQSISEFIAILTRIASKEGNGTRKKYLEDFAENFGLND
ncbi:hypothetical protein DUT91_03575 [Phyllobacterium salinisoli]|uniref:Uncharacterized protein n=1 Tax=Phyllobacterium salinisoli TaxID=1899321 RepID=A0A368KCN9_9HYPH|nr:hypothetical protein [Phyllobacterium salinisoli]RCS25850.1 hypothetical protein DUT91_03575 [Phyllobacterium salinisoli]